MTAGPLRIAHISATYPPYLGGAGTSCFYLADGLARRGHAVDVITAEVPGEPPASAATVRRLRRRGGIGLAPVLPGLLRLRGYDMVHLHYPFIFGTELLLAGRAARRVRAPLVVSYHQRLIGDRLRRPLFFAYEETWGRAMAANADRICVVSPQHAETVDYLRGVGRRHPERLVELPNGVDLGAFSPGPEAAGLRAEHGIADDAIVVAFVATLDRAHYLKRPDLAVEAIARAGDDRLHLLVAGGGEWLDDIRARARAAGLGDRTTFLGPVGHDRLPDVLRAADALLMTSDLESFGLVLIEAMACRLPTVSTDLPGVRAVVVDGETGLLAPAGDAAALAAGLRRIVEIGAEGREAMGAAGRRRCEERYGWDSLVERLEDVYREVLGT